ncbi:transferase family-domain-containing protein [Kockovaella imperatae]|uniref:Transferase family-domain-containing protein n=1 Tax=Kockovaella imperatae TaxID=4999 RepID=A0A1Y1UTH9_9TREE|nr:transferase family-domain-containing protein [Kockovaella imperatae]ORX41262.1 transferase family-domain-containing protein [Kockovaella imperatae]
MEDRTALLFPSTRPTPHSTPLSIIDSSVASYSPCSALWLFGKSDEGWSASALQESLRRTLDVYPQFSGKLYIPQYDAEAAVRDHTRRFGRIHIAWGNKDDPGLQFTFASSSKSAQEYIPLMSGQRTPLRTPWDLFPDLQSIPNPRREVKPCVLIKVTLFADGSLAVGIALHHSLSDIQTLCTFVRDWGAAHRNLTLTQRPFNPLAVDDHAPYLDEMQESPTLRDRALKIPQIRLDYWAGGPSRAIKSATAPHEAIDHLDEAQGRPRGTPIPWDTWDSKAPVSDAYIHFSREQLELLWTRASAGRRVSRLDALLAHLWRLVVKARQLQDEEIVHFDMSIGLRSRLYPPLGDTFLGSPLINISSSVGAAELIDRPLSDTAALIRHTVEKADSDSLNALLHHLAFALDPEREWNAFLGKHHCMVTSWLSTGSWNIDFGAGRPLEVYSGISALDGLMVIMDEPCDLFDASRRWYEDGVRIRMCLATNVMDKFLADPEFSGTHA